MRQIRSKVFETNSSSSHSLTMSDTELKPITFSPEVLRAGEVWVPEHQYNWEWHRYYAPLEKITYLAAACGHRVVENSALPEVVFEETGVKLKFSEGSYADVDHESVGTGSDIINDREQLKKFLFDSNSFVQTGNDNENVPWVIRTDLYGVVEAWSHKYKEVPEDFVPIEFKYYEYGFTGTKSGAFFGQEEKHCRGGHKLLDAIFAEGVVTKFVHQSPYGSHYGNGKDEAKNELAGKDLFFIRDVDAQKITTDSHLNHSEYDTYTMYVPKSLATKINRLKPIDERIWEYSRLVFEARNSASNEQYWAEWKRPASNNWTTDEELNKNRLSSKEKAAVEKSKLLAFEEKYADQIESWKKVIKAL